MLYLMVESKWMVPHLRKSWLQSTTASVLDKSLDYGKVVKTVHLKGI